MAVRITKPAFNLREKLSELDRPAGIIGTQVLKCNDLTELSKAVHTGRRNFLRNGAMEVWQRGTSFTNIYNYTADRWQATRYNGTVNQITKSENNSRIADEYGFNWYLKYGFNGTGGGGAAYLNQPLESQDSKKMRGKPVCFSFYAKTSSHHAGKPFKAGISWHTDTSYNDNGMYYWNFKNATTSSMDMEFHPSESWQRYWVTTNIPYNVEQVGVSLISKDYDEGDIDFTGCQLEIGNSPTPFEHLPYAEELALCQRYFAVYHPTSQERIYIEASNTTHRWWEHPIPAGMRTEPSITKGGTCSTLSIGIAGSLTINSLATTGVDNGGASGTTHPGSMGNVSWRVSTTSTGGTQYTVRHTDGWGNGAGWIMMQSEI